MPKFISGLKLSGLFHKVVKPVLEGEFPSLKYSVGLIGSGSEVLGFDTPQSVDHHRGPRMLLFLSEGDYKRALYVFSGQSIGICSKIFNCFHLCRTVFTVYTQ